MKFTDLFSHLDLATYPKIALVIFLAVFVAVLWKLARTPRSECLQHARMALDDDPKLNAGAAPEGATHG